MSNPQRRLVAHGVVGVGYEGRSVGEFIGLLRAEGVRIVVDARLTARCNRRGFSRHLLAEALRSAGIDYVHYEVLGNPEHNVGFRGSAAAVDAAAEVYRLHLASPAARQVVRDLVMVAGRRRVAVMTMEADAERCHRATLLAEIARVTQERREIDAVLADYAEPVPLASPARVVPPDARTQVERDIDELLAEFSPGARAEE